MLLPSSSNRPPVFPELKNRAKPIVSRLHRPKLAPMQGLASLDIESLIIIEIRSSKYTATV